MLAVGILERLHAIEKPILWGHQLTKYKWALIKFVDRRMNNVKMTLILRDLGILELIEKSLTHIELC